jgi:uroporphyrinogen-III synthase
MRIAVTRPHDDSERTAAALRARGHDVLVAPLVQIEPVAAEILASWAAVIVTSANAPGAIANHPARAALIKLPVFAVGRRSAEACRQTGFTAVITAGGDVHDLVRLIVERRADAAGPLLYLAGEDRAADLIGELTAHGIAAEMAVVYRAATTPFTAELIAALKAGEIDAVLHYSRRSAENYLAGAAQAGITKQALAVRHFCLSAQIAEPLAGVAGVAGRIAIASRPDEASLIVLLGQAQG